jgi:ElaB/YqjD/DUF883 family membrane-anchored ribosome-binding protein
MKKQKPDKSPKPAENHEKTPGLMDMEKLKQDIDDALAMREVLLNAIAQNPEGEAAELLANLDGAIEAGRRALSSMSAAEMRRQCAAIAEELTGTIENADDEEFLRLGDESQPARHLRNYVAVRDETVAALSKLHADDNPQEIINMFDRTIADARRQIKEKRDKAEKRFPNLRKEYEMDEGYKKALADLLESIETRDALAETLKLAEPDDRREGLRLLSHLDKKIEEGEQALAVEYEAFQTHERAKDDLRQLIKSYSPEELRGIRAHLKENPGSMELVEKMLEDEFPE